GDSRYPVPTLTLGTAEQNGAIMYYGVPEIMLEEKAYDVCASFGTDTDAALATVLGHELTHYYEKHGWRRGFVADYADLNIKMKLDSLQEKVGYETQADYIGGFLAYTAGYGKFDKGPELIQAIYDAYSLEDSVMTGYAPREDRKELSRRTVQKIEGLIDVFEMANLLAIIDFYPEARQYYHYVLREYQSREVYNNLGVLAVLEARRFFGEAEFKYHLPVELDLKSVGAKDPTPKEIEARNKLLAEALRHFDSAISLDPNYAPAYLNKACAYALLKDMPRAQFYAEVEAQQAAANSKTPEAASDARVLLGILAAMRGDNGQAQKTLEGEMAHKNALAGTNLKILLGQELEPPKPTLSKPESIDDVDLDEYKNAAKSIAKTPIDSGLTFHQDLPPGSKSKIFMTTKESSRPSIFFHITEPKYGGQSARNISIGADRATIVDTNAYGAPMRALKTPRGEILRYEKVIFVLGPEGKLERWVNYFKP
ncbi:MAG: hypothetical protein ACKVUS_07350, partial [Saprospiraceae bacterium]